jgi:hypothetical protein
MHFNHCCLASETYIYKTKYFVVKEINVSQFEGCHSSCKSEKLVNVGA